MEEKYHQNAQKLGVVGHFVLKQSDWGTNAEVFALKKPNLGEEVQKGDELQGSANDHRSWTGEADGLEGPEKRRECDFQ